MGQADRIDRRAMQIALSAFLFWIGIRLALPDNLIADNRLMSGMRFQSENAWTLECFMGGILGVYSAWTVCRRCELVATAALMSAHLSLSAFLLEGGATLLPGALFIFIGLCGWVLYRSWRERV